MSNPEDINKATSGENKDWDMNPDNAESINDLASSDNAADTGEERHKVITPWGSVEYMTKAEESEFWRAIHEEASN